MMHGGTYFEIKGVVIIYGNNLKGRNSYFYMHIIIIMLLFFLLKSQLKLLLNNIIYNHKLKHPH